MTFSMQTEMTANEVVLNCSLSPSLSFEMAALLIVTGVDPVCFSPAVFIDYFICVEPKAFWGERRTEVHQRPMACSW